VDRPDTHRTPARENLPDSSNVVTPLVGLFVIALIALVMWGLGLSEGPLQVELAQCAAQKDSAPRLACFDKLAAPHQPAKGAFVLFHSLPKARE
jgi:hypothetical protein